MTDWRIQREDGHLWVKERHLEQIFRPQPSEGTNPVNTLSLDLQIPGALDKKFLLFGHLICGIFVLAALPD